MHFVPSRVSAMVLADRSPVCFTSFQQPMCVCRVLSLQWFLSGISNPIFMMMGLLERKECKHNKKMNDKSMLWIARYSLINLIIRGTLRPGTCRPPISRFEAYRKCMCPVSYLQLFEPLCVYVRGRVLWCMCGGG